ncbi:MAG: UDP-N-acetylglucosamine 2-epimerase (hydrolyzing) [Elusimicrobia bacterium]|nr:UDP-N-acetylglucosamine 2-epimerase (hydrolyzing) [Elusimicrobiota bacterium]
MRRRIAVVTGARSDYGLLKGLLDAIRRRPDLRLLLIVTGQHLMRRFGLTVREIERDGLPIAARIDLGLRGDSGCDIAQAMGRGTLGFAQTYSRLKPDLLVVLGDRYEILSAASAALPFRLPVAHIHGGEATEGLIDEQIRHAVTKLSHIHFPATETYRERLLRMGEAPGRVFRFGSPGLDGIQRLPLHSKAALAEELRLPMQEPWGIVTYHPVTLERGCAAQESRRLIQALEHFPALFWVFTFPNMDTENSPIIRRIGDFVRRHPARAVAHASLGRLRYLSLLKHAALMVGNSSSGLIEAPSFRLPAVNIGNRQSGRLRAANVIDVKGGSARAIAAAIDKAMDPRWRRRLQGLHNPYAGRDASLRIAAVLARIPLDQALVKKSFFTPR